MNMSNSGKTFLQKTFFGTFFKNFFNGFEINAKFCVFDTFFDFFQKMFFRSYSTFSNFEAKCAKHGTKNQKTY